MAHLQATIEEKTIFVLFLFSLGSKNYGNYYTHSVFALASNNNNDNSYTALYPVTNHKPLIFLFLPFNHTPPPHTHTFVTTA